MIDHRQIQLALRTKLATLSVATTGSTTLAATSTGYSRASGDFLADGFEIGMQITGTGFTNAANNAAKVITAVTATAITAAGTVVEASSSGRTVLCGLPPMAYEGSGFKPVVGTPHIEEQYVGGPSSKITLGTLAQLQPEPLYVLLVHVPANTGKYAAARYADALITLFTSGTAMTLTNGDVLRVRGDTGPFPGQFQKGPPGFMVQPVSFPLRLRTANSI